MPAGAAVSFHLTVDWFEIGFVILVLIVTLLLLEIGMLASDVRKFTAETRDHRRRRRTQEALHQTRAEAMRVIDELLRAAGRSS
jgi:uncharacterized protein HemY